MLTRDQEDALRALTVHVVLEMRAQYLANGANPLSHWEQLQTRLLAATKQSATASEWCTTMARKLGLGAGSKGRCSAEIELHEAVDVPGLSFAWLGMLERHCGLVMAEARVEAEGRRAARNDAAMAAGSEDAG